jgi:hypothetical protein
MAREIRIACNRGAADRLSRHGWCIRQPEPVEKRPHGTALRHLAREAAFSQQAPSQSREAGRGGELQNANRASNSRRRLFALSAYAPLPPPSWLDCPNNGELMLPMIGPGFR